MVSTTKRFFLDTEFNGQGGELISMALVGDDGSEFYEALKFVEPVNAWVAEHVMPKIGQEPILWVTFLRRLCDFLSAADGCEIVADWPADFEHLSTALTAIGAADSFIIPLECTMRLVRGDDTIAPENPHNALSDARALRDWWGVKL